MLNEVAQAIFDKKGFNILALDISEVSTLTDYFLIAEGNVDRHVKAISDEVIDRLSQLGQKPLHVEGGDSADWIVLDYGEILIHLFVPEKREKYRLEELWHDGEIVDLKIDITDNESM